MGGTCRTQFETKYTLLVKNGVLLGYTLAPGAALGTRYFTDPLAASLLAACGDVVSPYLEDVPDSYCSP